MTKLYFTIALLFTAFFCTAQKVSAIDFDSIKIRLNTTPTYYPDLLEHYEKGDSTLTEQELQVIYYGQCFQKDYSPYSSDIKSLDKFKEAYGKANFKDALPLVLKILEKDPLNMQMTFKALVCYYKLNNNEGRTVMNTRYNKIMMTIFQSGTGKTSQSAFVVMRVSDEYELMSTLEVENVSQSLVEDCDLMELKENNLGLERLYFNVSKPLQALSEMFKRK